MPRPLTVSPLTFLPTCLHNAYMAHLTKSLIERTEPPKSGQLFLRDDEITGFALRVTSNGAKSFVWEGRINGRMCRDTLGRFPDLSVVGARAKAFEYKASIARGENPVGLRDAERAALRAEKPFAQLVDEYLNLHAKPHKRSWREDERMARRYLPSSWSSRRLSDFSRHEIVRLHQIIGHEHGHYAANRLVALLRTMFNRAKLWGMIKEENPVRGIKLFHEEKRERFLTADEIARHQPGSDERARLALARLFPLEPLAWNTPRRTHYGPLGRHRLRAGRVAHSQYEIRSPPPASTSAGSGRNPRKVAQSQ